MPAGGRWKDEEIALALCGCEFVLVLSGLYVLHWSVLANNTHLMIIFAFAFILELV